MSYLKELNQLVVYMEKFSARLDAENSVNRHKERLGTIGGNA